MKPPANKKLDKLISTLPRELSDFVSLWIERLEESHPDSVANSSSSPDFLECMTRLVAVSEFAANTIVREWPWVQICRDAGAFQQAPALQDI